VHWHRRREPGVAPWPSHANSLLAPQCLLLHQLRGCGRAGVSQPVRGRHRDAHAGKMASS
jgi:hypothetical protein